MRVWLLFLILMSGFSAGAAAPEGCPAPQGLTETSMNPLQIAAWLKSVGTSVRSPEQLVCCLPKKFKSQYIVGHSSLAGQNGTVSAPRIIAFDTKNDTSNSSTKQMLALSISGGTHAGLQQKDSVEFMYLNPRTQQLEYFDLEFRKGASAHLSRANPELCMNCHGNDGKVPAGGPRPIFDSFAEWNRFVGGRGRFCSSSEQLYFRKVEAMAVDSVRKNPKLKCLDASVLDKKPAPDVPQLLYPQQFGHLAVFDAALKVENRKRVIKLMKSYPSYKTYRFSLVGLSACGGSLRDWLPSEVVDAMSATARAAAGDFKGPGQGELKNKMDLLKAQERRRETLMSHQLALKSIDGEKPAMIPPISETQCRNSDPTAFDRTTLTSAAKITDANDRAMLLHFQRSNQLKGVDGDPVASLLFQAAGEDTSLWEMAPTGEGAMTPLITQLPRLDDLDLGDAKTTEILGRFFEVREIGDMTPFGPPGEAFLGRINDQYGLLEKQGFDSCGEFKKFVQKSFAPAFPASGKKTTVK